MEKGLRGWGPSLAPGRGQCHRQLSSYLPSPKAQAVKEMASMVLGFNYDATEKEYL